MRVLVTGATGFIGGHVIQRLLERGHSVVAVARGVESARKFDWHHRVEFFANDIYRSDDWIQPHLASLEAAIHLAWSGLPNYKALFHFEENLLSNYYFLKRLIDGGIKQLVVAGTCFEYGMQDGCLAENSATLPANPYALAKDTLRKFLTILTNEKSITFQWARLFYMYGRGQNEKSLLAQLDKAIASGEQTFNMSGGEQLRDYLPIEDVASKLVRLMEHPNCTGPVNICSGKPISVRSLVERYLDQRGVTMRLNLGHYAYNDYEPMAFWGSNEKYIVHCNG